MASKWHYTETKAVQASSSIAARTGESTQNTQHVVAFRLEGFLSEYFLPVSPYCSFTPYTMTEQM